MISAPFAEVHVPDGATFPLRAAADLAPKEVKDPNLHDITAADIPFSSVAPSDAARKMAEHITLEHISQFGVMPGRKACAFDSAIRSPVWRARFDALIKADRICKDTGKGTGFSQ